MKKLVSVILLAGILSSPGAAEDFYPALDAPPFLAAGVVDDDQLNLSVSNGRSFCCQMTNPTNALAGTGGGFTSFKNFDSIIPTYRGKEIPAAGGAVSNRRYCWAEADEGNFTALRMGVLGNFSGGQNVYFSCEETTLYGNYNTSVSELNFLELTAGSGEILNEGNKVSGVITFISSVNGRKVTEEFEADLSQTSSIRRDYAVHDLIGGSADFGQVIIRHDGAPGQLSARLSQYDITSVDPFDFSLVGQADLRRGRSGQK